MLLLDLLIILFVTQISQLKLPLEFQNPASDCAQRGFLCLYVLVYDHGVRWITIEMDDFKVSRNMAFCHQRRALIAIMCQRQLGP